MTYQHVPIRAEVLVEAGKKKFKKKKKRRRKNLMYCITAERNKSQSNPSLATSVMATEYRTDDYSLLSKAFQS